MTIDFGIDLSCVDDLTEEMRVETDPKIILAQALIRRWSTPRGMVLDDPDYGTDLSEFINEEFDNLTMVRLRAAMRSEALKDERVVNCTIVDSTFDEETKRAILTVTIDAGETNIRLKVAVSEVTITLLSTE